MTITQLIGNEEKKDEDLVKTANSNAVIKDLIRSKNIGELALEPCDEADLVIGQMEWHLKSSDYRHNTELFKYKVASDEKFPLYQKRYEPDSNMLMAAIYSVLGQKQKAKKIMKEILDNYELYNDTGLIIRTSWVGSSNVEVPDNAMSCLAYLSLGMKTEAENIMKSIETNIEFSKEHGMINKELKILGEKLYRDKFTETLEVASIALAYAALGQKSKAETQIVILEKNVKYDKDIGLFGYDTSLNFFNPNSDSNLLLAPVYYYLGDNEKASRLIKSVEKFIGIDYYYKLVKYTGSHKNTSFFDPDYNAFPNAALALAYMAREAHK